MKTTLTLAAAAFAMTTAVAHAQDEAAFIAAFEGDWFSFDPASAAPAQSCRIALRDEAKGEMLAALSTGCAGPLARIDTWQILEGQIRFADDEGGEVAVLGGNQVRISGEAAATGDGIVLERATGDASSRAVRTAIARYRCLFAGFTSDCATEDQLSQPTLDGPEGTSTIRTLVNLNVRSQPRSDSSAIGVLPKDTDIIINDCLVASDGLWCRASFGDTSGWLARTALRQEQWPILTYVTTAPASEAEAAADG